MTHRKYSRSRRAISRAMARNPGQRKPKYMRMEQAEQDRAIAKVVENPVLQAPGTPLNRGVERTIDPAGAPVPPKTLKSKIRGLLQAWRKK